MVVNVMQVLKTSQEHEISGQIFARSNDDDIVLDLKLVF